MAHENAKPDSYYLPDDLWRKGRTRIFAVGGIAWLLTIAGWAANPQQFYYSYISAFWFAFTIALGGLFWASIQYTCGDAASTTVRRLIENIAIGLPYALLLFIPVAIGVPSLYAWAHPNLVAADPILRGRGVYFTPAFFIARAILYLAIFAFCAIKLYGHATRMDKTKTIRESIAACKDAEHWSAASIVVLFIVTTMAAWEWIMSLDPQAFSTIFGAYSLANGALACTAVVFLISYWLRRHGVLDHSINREHYHDLGKWMFTVTIFWSYTAFAQYMLIWYGNIPQETQFFWHRYVGAWYSVGMLLIFGHFIFPFLLLIGRPAKRTFGTLAAAACWLLFVCYADVYWLVMPMLHKDTVHVHWLDFTCLAAVGSVYAFAFWQRMKKHAIVPVGDVRLVQSLAFKNQ